MSAYSFTEELRQAQQNARKKLEKKNMNITITLEEYNKLLERDSWLTALEAAGVDNWEGISYAHEIYREDNPDAEEN